MRSAFYGPRDGGWHDASAPITAYGEPLIEVDLLLEDEPGQAIGEQPSEETAT